MCCGLVQGWVDGGFGKTIVAGMDSNSFSPLQGDNGVFVILGDIGFDAQNATCSLWGSAISFLASRR